MNCLLQKVGAILVLLTIAATCQSQQQKIFDEVSKKTHEAVTPIPHTRVEVADWWMPRHEANNKRLAEGNVDLLLIGNSIMNGWDGPGREVYNQYYEKRNTVNMGFGWDRTQHVLWRLDNADFSKVNPKLAMILIGTNNLGINSPEEIAEGIIAICGRIRNKLPETKILLLAIFPRDQKPSKIREDAAKVNMLTSKIADGDMISYLDIGEIFMNQDGTVRADLMPDFLHPNAEGYKLWAEKVEPKVAELMK